ERGLAFGLRPIRLNSELPGRPQRRVEKPAHPQPRERPFEMCRGTGPLAAFEPILIKEGGEGRLAELDLPEDAEQRGHCLLALAGDSEEALCPVRRRPTTGLRTSAEAEINEAAPFGRGELVVRDFVKEDVGLGIGAQASAVPREILGRAAGS